MTKMNRLTAALIAALILPTAHAAQQQDIDAVIQPLMKKYGVPGMAIAVSVDGKQQIYPYGVASKQTGKPITEQTLFEVGSLSKTFTATLAVYAQQQGKLSFKDPASHYLPELRGSAFDGVSLLNLATHTSGLPLFVPDDVTNNAQLMAYYRAWQPKHPVGSYRVYSNLGIGMLGMIAAKSLDQPFIQAMEQGMLPALGMSHTYVQVPAAQMANYAQGYSKDDKPVRVNPGPLDAESYGIKSNARDLIRYLDANLQQVKVAQPWRDALAATHVGYYKAGAFTQDLMWENYPYPEKLSRLVEGNNAGMIMNGTPATAITPPQPELRAGWYNKTGSTGGFSTYAVFIPAKNIAVVMLANKWFPNDDRVEAAYHIIQALDKR